jgi:ABC-type sugar transport system substrate-binding protein
MPAFTFTRRFWRPVAVAAVATMLVAGTVACSSSGGSGGDAEAGGEVGTGSLEGGGALLKVFMPSTSNIYLKAAAEAVEAQAEELDYTVNIVENNWDQTEQDQQVQDWLATGEEAAAVLFWPASAAAATNSARLLSAAAPVFQWNQLVQADATDYITAYSGVSDFGIGEQAGVDALDALEQVTASGMQFHGPDGKPNLLEIRFMAGYQAGDDRQEAFADATGDAFNVLAVEPTPTSPDAQGGFAAASQVVPQYLSQGIDFVYAHSNDVANGVVQALEQNGLKPGEDVIVITGTSSGDLTNLKSGKIWSTVLQSPVIEGQLLVRTAAQYIATGEIQDGEYTLPEDAEKPELTAEAPYTANYMMNPQVTAENIDSLKIWGFDFYQLMGE